MSPPYSNAIDELLTLGRRSKRVPATSAEVLELPTTPALGRNATRVEAVRTFWAETGPAASASMRKLQVQARVDASRGVARIERTEFGEVVFTVGFVLCKTTPGFGSANWYTA
ncbi:MAG: hypothetical protein ACRD3J_30440, partial [Thermoanaerobaculia bacterium]